ncbi:MAG TPA: transposase [Thermomicrobiales bacterium]|nr:transposase [Thermomicrobiales bacterium]
MDYSQRRVRVTSRRRLRGYDYAEPASYYVMLCTEGRLPFFGNVHEGGMTLSVPGEVVTSWWATIPLRFPATELDALVVMPNHLHGVLMIQAAPTVSLPEGIPSRGRVMQWFKSITTVEYTRGVRDYGWPPFPGRLWQPGFHDHIVRNDRDLERIRAYIDGNPTRWVEDEFHVESRDGMR